MGSLCALAYGQDIMPFWLAILLATGGIVLLAVSALVSAEHPCPRGASLTVHGPEQAAAWRQGEPWSLRKGVLPDLMFPADRAWLFSTLWDDDWSCIGGPAALVSRFVDHPDLEARSVDLSQDATPPGHQAI